MSRKEMEPLIQGTGASFTDVATQQTELFEGRETDIMGCFRSLAQEMGNPTDAPMMVSMMRTAPRHMELQMPGTIRWMQKIQPHVVLFCPFMNAEARGREGHSADEMVFGRVVIWDCFHWRWES